MKIDVSMFKPPKHAGDRPGILTLQQAREYQQRFQSVQVMASVNEAFPFVFFTGEYGYGYDVLPRDFVASTTRVPMKVVERKGLEDGWVDTVEKYLMVFEHDRILIESIEDLVEVMNKV